MNVDESRICVIGNCPSSGSTLLADLVDSLPIGMCGPELNLFSNRRFYNPNFRGQDIFKYSSSASAYKTRIGLNEINLPEYGLSPKQLLEIFSDTGSLEISLSSFVNHFKEFRKKKSANVWFEKTPENIGCVSEFCERFPEQQYISVTRNPYNTIHSLTKRGFGLELALATWLVDNSILATFKSRYENLTVLSYEELVNHPFEVASQIASLFTDRVYSPEELELSYSANSFREKTLHLSSWSQSFGAIASANGEVPQPIVSYVNSNLNTKVGTQYANHFNFDSHSLLDLMHILNYDELGSVDFGEQDSYGDSLVKPSNDRLHYFKKFANSVLYDSLLGSYSCLIPLNK